MNRKANRSQFRGRSRAGSLSILIAGGVLGVMASCKKESNSKTISGPEYPSLLQKISGHIITTRPVGGIISVSLPDRREEVVRPNGQTSAIYSLSGPDQMGRIAYVEYQTTDHRYAVKTIQLNGSDDQTVIQGRGDVLFEHALGRHMGLASRGGLVAVLHECAFSTLNNPDATIQTCTLEVWDIVTHTRRASLSGVLDSTLSWFPDGRRLACVRMVERKELQGERDPIVGGVIASFGKWRAVPAVFVFDLDDGGLELVTWGWEPVVAINGVSILINGFGDDYVEWNVAERFGRRVQWPGNASGPIAFGEDWVVYRGRPTKGAPTQWSRNNSPFVGRKAMESVKISLIGSRLFQTILPYVDPRAPMSVGCETNKE